MKYSALNAIFSSLSADPLGSKISTDILLIITSTSDELLRSVNIDDLE